MADTILHSLLTLWCQEAMGRLLSTFLRVVPNLPPCYSEFFTSNLKLTRLKGDTK